VRRRPADVRHHHRATPPRQRTEHHMTTDRRARRLLRPTHATAIQPHTAMQPTCPTVTTTDSAEPQGGTPANRPLSTEPCHGIPSCHSAD